MKQFIYLFVFFLSTISIAQNNSIFDKANSLYNNEEYTEAIKMYELILENGVHAPELYFNLGNAHYRLNHIAPSIYYFEKALQLTPNDKEIKNNLAFAQNMTIDAIDNVPEVGFSRVIKSITNTFKFDQWAKLSIVFVLCFVISFLVYYFTLNSFKKRISFITSSVSIVLSVIAISFAFNKYGLVKNDNPAIVFAQDSQVKSEPNLRSVETFKLHEGTKVQVLDTVNNWKKIKLSDGKTGWISSEDIKLLNNF